QITPTKIKPVHAHDAHLDLETTAKLGFTEHRLTPVLAPYNGRVLEVRRNKGDVVTAGQPLLVIDSADLVATVNDLSQAISDADKARIAVDQTEKAAQRAKNLHDQEALATKELQAAET